MIASQLSTLMFHLFYTIFPLLMALACAVLLVDVLRRPIKQFNLARKGKEFWLAILGLAMLWFILQALGVHGPFQNWITFAMLFGVVFYAGPERQNMGEIWRRGK